MGSEHRQKRHTGQLFIVATPIGNLDDITYRAVETLRQVDLIAAEDTRVSRKLLNHYGITTPMITCHEHNEREAANTLQEKLESGANIALISDAGTPLINDPGYRLVSRLREAEIPIVPIPGPSSPITALCASGLPTDRFTYLGFLPRSGRSRREALERIADSDCTQVLMESPKRLAGTLDDLLTVCGPTRHICIARELTKLHEEFIRGLIGEVLSKLQERTIRGEIVLLVEEKKEASTPATDETILERLADTEMLQLAPSSRAKQVAKELNLPRDRVYNLLLTQNDSDEQAR